MSPDVERGIDPFASSVMFILGVCILARCFKFIAKDLYDEYDKTMSVISSNKFEYRSRPSRRSATAKKAEVKDAETERKDETRKDNMNTDNKDKTTGGNSETDQSSKPEYSDDSNDEDTCAVCLERKRNTVILPCGHTEVCNICIIKIVINNTRTCPICRCEMENYKRLETHIQCSGTKSEVGEGSS